MIAKKKNNGTTETNSINTWHNISAVEGYSSSFQIKDQPFSKGKFKIYGGVERPNKKNISSFERIRLSFEQIKDSFERISKLFEQIKD